MNSHKIMANITLAIPDELHSKIKVHNEIRWSEIVRNILQRKIEQFELLEKLTSRSKLTEEDVEEIGKKIKRGIAQKHGLR